MQHSKIQLEKKNCTRFPSAHSSISAMTPEADQRAAVELLHSVDRVFQPLEMIKELKWLRASWQSTAAHQDKEKNSATFE
jgi:hypothetical protein